MKAHVDRLPRWICQQMCLDNPLGIYIYVIGCSPDQRIS